MAMKILSSFRSRHFSWIAGFVVWFPFVTAVYASFPPPPGTNTWLNLWSFTDTNAWTSDKGYAPISFTNLNASNLGDGTALVLDSSAPAWLQYRVNEADGTNNLTVQAGTVLFWFAPDWKSTNYGGTGPGQWGRLIEVGSYTTNANYGWWSLYTDPAGMNLYFSAQNNSGSQTTYLSAPVSWDTTNYWHLIALTYSSSNSALYLDGRLLTNGLPVTIWPGTSVLTNGFYIGSDATGTAQAHGMFDDVETYNYPIAGSSVTTAFIFGSQYYYGNPMNMLNLRSAPSQPQITPTFLAITGSGNLTNLGPASVCVTNSSNVWFTNVSTVLTTNGSVNVTFTIAGAWNGLAGPFDVFANAVIGPTNTTAFQWAWCGQGYSCNTDMLTNLPFYSVYLILGTPQDSDSDGLTDAYELLVSHSNPNQADSSGDGMLDGWKVLWGLNPSVKNWAQSTQRSNFGYQPQGWLQTVSGVRAESISFDFEGNIFGDQ